MTKDNSKLNHVDFAFCKKSFEKFGKRRLFSRDEYFARSGEVMEYLGGLNVRLITFAPLRDDKRASES